MEDGKYFFAKPINKGEQEPCKRKKRKSKRRKNIPRWS